MCIGEPRTEKTVLKFLHLQLLDLPAGSSQYGRDISFKHLQMLNPVFPTNKREIFFFFPPRTRQPREQERLVSETRTPYVIWLKGQIHFRSDSYSIAILLHHVCSLEAQDITEDCEQQEVAKRKKSPDGFCRNEEDSLSLNWANSILKLLKSKNLWDWQ